MTDGLFAATTREHWLKVVTRNTGDFEPARVETVSPFAAAG